MVAGLRVGLVARGERQRGIGVQTRGYAAHLPVERTLVVDVGVHEDFPKHPEDFPNPTVVRMHPGTGELPERATRRWLVGLDVVLFVESPYDHRLLDWAREMGVRTIGHLNPEFYRHDQMPHLPHPDVWWVPTTWRMDLLPEGTVHVPVPVDLTKFPPRKPVSIDGPVRFLHAAGKVAEYDRNGTEPFVRACYLNGGLLDATVTSLIALPDRLVPGGDWVKVRVGGVENYWEGYDGYDVLVLPRRYGGLCLPVQEAMAAGLAVVMPDVSPNRDWPIIPVVARWGGRALLPTGRVPLAEVDPSVLAMVMRALADNPAEVAEAQVRSRAWAEAHSWENLVPVYMDELAAVVEGRRSRPRGRRTHGDPFRA